jgi:hypothetical protein
MRHRFLRAIARYASRAAPLLIWINASRLIRSSLAASDGRAIRIFTFSYITDRGMESSGVRQSSHSCRDVAAALYSNLRI